MDRLAGETLCEFRYEQLSRLAGETPREFCYELV